MRIHALFIVLAAVALPARAVIAQSATDSAGIRATAHDDIDG